MKTARLAMACPVCFFVVRIGGMLMRCNARSLYRRNRSDRVIGAMTFIDVEPALTQEGSRDFYRSAIYGKLCEAKICLLIFLLI